MKYLIKILLNIQLYLFLFFLSAGINQAYASENCNFTEGILTKENEDDDFTFRDVKGADLFWQCRFKDSYQLFTLHKRKHISNTGLYIFKSRCISSTTRLGKLYCTDTDSQTTINQKNDTIVFMAFDDIHPERLDSSMRNNGLILTDGVRVKEFEEIWKFLINFRDSPKEDYSIYLKNYKKPVALELVENFRNDTANGKIESAYFNDYSFPRNIGSLSVQIRGFKSRWLIVFKFNASNEIELEDIRRIVFE